MPLTVPQTQLILNSYFQNGQKPDQDKFMEFIGTMFYLFQQAENDVAALSNVAAQVTGAAPDFLLIAKRLSAATLAGADPRDASAHWGILRSFNFDHVTAYAQAANAPLRYNFWTQRKFSVLPDSTLTLANFNGTSIYQGTGGWIQSGGANNEFGTSAFQIPYNNSTNNGPNVPVNGTLRIISWGVLA